jgi:hypothetical protein
MLIAINPIKERSFKYVKFLGKKKKTNPKILRAINTWGKLWGKKSQDLNQTSLLLLDSPYL